MPADNASQVADAAPPILGGTPGNDAKDGGGLRRVASAVREGLPSKGRGAYRCKRCGQRHGEGNACGSPVMASKSPAASAPRVDLFNAENTARIVRMPFAISAIRTGCADLALDDRQEKELATTGSLVLNEWVAVDPKYVALALFTISLCGVAFEKLLVYQMWTRVKEIELEKLKLQAQTRRPNQAEVEPPPVGAQAPGESFKIKDPPPLPKTT